MPQNGGMKIEKGIPMPNFGERSLKGHSKYPWREMEIGDSFVMPKPIGIARSTMRTLVRRHDPSIRFICRSIDENSSRVWRAA